LISSYLLIFALSFLLANFTIIPSGWPVIIGVLAIAIVGFMICRATSRVAASKLIRRAWDGCEISFVNGDHSEGLRKADEILTVYRRSVRGKVMTSMAEASVLALQQRYGDALIILEGIDGEKVDRAFRPHLLNNRAWYEAQLGRAAEAIKHATNALELAESLKVPFVASCRGTLGTALFVANRSSEALPLLLKAFEGHSGQPRLRATNAYYLGVVYKDMNQIAQARSWLECAVREAPKTRFGARASAALRDFPIEV